mgnify:CR=1 FL=1
MSPDLKAALAVSDLLFDRAAIERETRRIAAEIDRDYAGGERPVYLSIMHGGMLFASQLALEAFFAPALLARTSGAPPHWRTRRDRLGSR